MSRGSGQLLERASLAADRSSWSPDRHIEWGAVDRSRANAHPEILSSLRTAPITGALNWSAIAVVSEQLFADPDARAILSLQLVDELKHSRAVRRYLETVGHEPGVSNDKSTNASVVREYAKCHSNDLVRTLVDAMLRLHFAHYSLRRLGERAEEPVLADLLLRIAADDLRNADNFAELIAAMISRDSSVTQRVLDAAANFHGSLLRDPMAIQSFVSRIERLCGTRLVDHMKQRL